MTAILTWVWQTKGVIVTNVFLALNLIKPSTTDITGIGAVVTPIHSRGDFHKTCTTIQILERFAGVTEIFAVVPCCSWGAITLVVMAFLYCSAVSRSTGVGLTDIEWFSTVSALVSWVWREGWESRGRARKRDIKEDRGRGIGGEAGIVGGREEVTESCSGTCKKYELV